MLATLCNASNGHCQGITTYVVGMGMDFNNTSVLDAMAQAGGTGAAYQAGSPAALLAAIQSIIGSALSSCNITLTPPPASPELIEVTIDGAAPLTLNDATNGFTYMNGTVMLGTAVCMEVKSGGHQVDVTGLASLDGG